MNQDENKVIDDLYAPYDWSKTKCYVIPIKVAGSGYLKIEHKLPNHIKEVKDIFLSVNCTDHRPSKAKLSRVAGYISLNFNGHVFKTLSTALLKTYFFKDTPNPFPVDAELEPNSFLQGYYWDVANPSDGYPYLLNIYLHYIPNYHNNK